MTVLILTLEPVYYNKHKNYIVINRKDNNVADYIVSKGGKIVVPQEVRFTFYEQSALINQLYIMLIIHMISRALLKETLDKQLKAP